MFWWRGSVESGGRRADVAFTDRDGGGSTGSLGSLNLGGSVGDDPQIVRDNRAAVARAMDLSPEQLVFMHQVHGNQVVRVGKASLGEPAPQCDGQITGERGLGLAVLVADCTPVLLVDTEAGLVAAAHAGRPGMTSGVVAAVLDEMAMLGARNPQGIVGPSVCKVL